jgi:hypothetical protein
MDSRYGSLVLPSWGAMGQICLNSAFCYAWILFER